MENSRQIENSNAKVKITMSERKTDYISTSKADYFISKVLRKEILSFLSEYSLIKVNSTGQISLLYIRKSLLLRANISSKYLKVLLNFCIKYCFDGSLLI